MTTPFKKIKKPGTRSPFSPVKIENNMSQYEAAEMESTAIQDLVGMFKDVSIVDPNQPGIENAVFEYEKELKEMDRFFNHQSEEHVAKLPPYEKPAGFKEETELYPHQQDGVRWLINQEKKPRPNPFQRERTLNDGTVAIYDVLDNSRLPARRPPANGAILADDMGLGKTVQALGLILSNPPPPVPHGSPTSICTLAVCPKTVIPTWQREIEKFVKPGFLRTLVFEGTPNQRSKIIEKVRSNQVDLLLVPYSRVARDAGDTQRGEVRHYNGYGHPLLDLFDISFYRIILDEAQEIRTGTTKKHKGVLEIAKKARHRVALTGTPLINSPLDVQALLSFVGMAPWDDKALFNRYIAKPIADRKRSGLTKLRTALTYVSFRRTKAAVKDLALVKKTVEVVSHTFIEGSFHQQVHDYWLDETKKAYCESEQTKEVVQRRFAVQMKLRQSCDSGTLVVPKAMKEMAAKSTAMEPKIYGLFQGIDQMKRDEKGIIFSQFKGFLDIVEKELVNRHYKVVRLDGSMNIEARVEAMKALEEDQDVRFILCSLKVGGFGINLTRANVVFLMDSWWNAATEAQAVDRCHRLGQERPVRVYRFVMKDSIEEKMVYHIQEAKTKLGKGAMAHLTAEELKLAKIMTLKDFFGVEANADGECSEEDDDDCDWV